MLEVHRNRWYESVTGYVLKRSTYFTCDAKVTHDKAITYGMKPHRIAVFPWGVDLERFRPKNEQTENQNNVLNLLCNRAWEPLYGIDVLVRAFVKAARSRPELSLTLLGGGSQGAQIRQILLNGGVLDRVTFGGQISQTELPRWYHWADVYISPSHVDGSSVSLMEALACGLPCLVSDIPGNREWVTEDENGWLFPDGDVDGLATKILQVFDNRKSLPEIGSAARALAEERADWKKNSVKLMQAYHQALQLN
jgi:glycosyltransferase involved in cell wall biosynthesis